jgi:hypothetical protein
VWVKSAGPDAPPPLAANLHDHEAIDAVRGHRLFPSVAHRMCRGALNAYGAADPFDRWAVSDLGRLSLTFIATVLDHLQGGVTAADLKTHARRNRVASPGRVTAYIDACLKAGRMHLTPGSSNWTQRRLELDRALLKPLAALLIVQLDSCASLIPEARDAANHLDGDPRAIRRAMVHAVWLVTSLEAATPQQSAWADPLRFFMDRSSGMRFLQHLMAETPTGQAFPLTPTRLNKSLAARICGVSRRHLDHLLSDAAQAGLLQISHGRIIVSTQVAQALETYFAIYVCGLRLIARSITGCRT